MVLPSMPKQNKLMHSVLMRERENTCKVSDSRFGVGGVWEHTLTYFIWLRQKKSITIICMACVSFKVTCAIFLNTVIHFSWTLLNEYAIFSDTFEVINVFLHLYTCLVTQGRWKHSQASKDQTLFTPQVSHGYAFVIMIFQQCMKMWYGHF